MAEIERDMFE